MRISGGRHGETIWFCLSGDQCFSFYPFLWAKEGSLLASRRKIAPVHEVFDLKTDLLRQIEPHT